MTVDPQTIGGYDIGQKLAEGLAPLTDIVTALNRNNTLLSNIHQELNNTIGFQMAMGGTARATIPPVAQPTQYVPGPQAPPGTTGSPTPLPRGPGGIGPPPGGGGGGGGGVPPGGGGPAPAPQGGAPSGYAPPVSAGGAGLFDRLYNKATQAVPWLSIPGSLRNEYQAQINKNAFYTGITGAESQREAFGMRIEEDINRLRYSRLFNKEEFEQAHKGLAALGINTREEGIMTDRPTYREGMDFAYHAKERYGATIEESMQRMAIAASTASSDVEQLNNDLDLLSESAGNVGVSAAKAREQVDKAWALNIQAGMPGQAGQNWASAAVAANVAAGPMFAGKSGANRLATDAGYLAMTGASAGVTPGAMTTMMYQNPAQAAAMQTQQFVEHMHTWFAQTNPDGWAWLEQQAASGVRDPYAIAEDFMTRHWNDPRPPEAMVGYANIKNPTGQPFANPLDVIAEIIRQMGPNTTAASLAEGGAKAGTMTMEGTSTVTGEKVETTSLEDLGSAATTTGAEVTPGAVAASGRYGAGASVAAAATGATAEAGAATDIYKAGATETGERSGAMEMLLKSLSGKEEEESMVSVTTKDGQRVMTLAEALKGGYADQITTGQAYFMTGEHAGETIAEYTGGAVETSEEATTRAKTSAERSTSVGQTEEEYIEEHPEAQKYLGKAKEEEEEKEGAGTTSVYVDLSPDAKKWFKVVSNSGNDPTQPPENNNGSGGSWWDNLSPFW